MTTPPTETRTRFGFAVMVIGWSGPGSFMVSPYFGQPVVIVVRGPGGFAGIGSGI
jgi:hypothetical protein